MPATSLSLLKGGKKHVAPTVTAVSEDPENHELDISAAEDAPVEIDDMTSAELDALIVEHSVEVPDSWSTYDAAKKIEWLKTNMTVVDEDAATEVERAPEAASKAAKGKKTAKTPSRAPSPAVAEAQEALPAPVVVVPAKAAKKAAKTKDVAVAPLNGEVQAPDDISDLVHEIENLNEAAARNLMMVLADQSEGTYFKIGGVLSVILKNGWYKPYPNFKTFVEDEYKIAIRTAEYWVKIYNTMANGSVPWDKVKTIGWKKLKEVAKIITPENVDGWVEAASNNNVSKFVALVDQTRKGEAAATSLTSEKVTAITFKPHEGQREVILGAVEKAKQALNTKYDTVALEAICQDYLASTTWAEKAMAMGMEKFFEAAQALWPNINIEVSVNEDIAA